MNMRDLMVLKGGKIVLLTSPETNAEKAIVAQAMIQTIQTAYAFALEGKQADGTPVEAGQ